MKWIAIAGGWRKTNALIEKEVSFLVREILIAGNGIVSGGALGVDYIATEVALDMGVEANQLKIIIPTSLNTYRKHYLKRAKEGIITENQATMLIAQLEEVQRRGCLIEGTDIILEKETYYDRIKKIIESADELVAFHINQTEGTQYTIDQAHKKGVPVKLFTYTIL